VAAFNAEQRAPQRFGMMLERLLPAEVYARVQGADDVAGELDRHRLGRTLPKKIDGGAGRIGPDFYAAYDVSPFSAEDLGAFVQRAIAEEKLGRHTGTDLLGVSFSQVDAAGHGYGPDSHEMMDSMLRLDRLLAALLATLEREVGLAKCVVVLTADHGVAPLPERAGAGAGGRVKPADLNPIVQAALDAKFGALPQGESWATRDVLSYQLRPAALAARGVSAGEAAAVVKAALLAVPAIEHVFTRDELRAAPTEGDSALAMARRSSHAERIRDLLFFYKPNFLPVAIGSTHATPNDYDIHVPIVFFGAGVPKLVSSEAVGVEQLAPTMAGLLGMPPPPLAKGKNLF
jgi:predicted AlkP superfamily pyrophosphatase or phosphodiesterase